MDALQSKREQLELENLLARKAKADANPELRDKTPETYTKICARITELQKNKTSSAPAITMPAFGLPLDKLPKWLMMAAASIHAMSVDVQVAVSDRDEKVFSAAASKWFDMWQLAIKDMEKAYDETRKMKQLGFEEVDIDVNAVFGAKGS